MCRDTQLQPKHIGFKIKGRKHQDEKNCSQRRQIPYK